MLFAREQGATVFRRYRNDTGFRAILAPRSGYRDRWPRLARVLAEAGAPAGFQDRASKRIRDEVARISRAAEADGVFGVPSFIVGGELFWGREHLPAIRQMLAATA